MREWSMNSWNVCEKDQEEKEDLKFDVQILKWILELSNLVYRRY